MSAAVHRSILIALTIAVAALAVSSVRLDSATADEGAHIAAGIIKLRHGWLSYFAEQPPLMNAITALPLGGFRMRDTWRDDQGPGSHWRAGHELLYQSDNDAHRLLLLARLPTIALFLALCFAVYWIVSSEAGRTWGLVAFALTGFCPNLLAHGRLATVDMAATAFTFIGFVFLASGGRLTHARAALAGICGMCAILSKTSAVIAVPFFAIVLVLQLWRTRAWRPAITAVVAAVITLYAVTFLLIGSGYLASHFAGTPRLLVPWLQYKEHVDKIRFWYGQGHEHPQFLLGEFSRTGWPHYFFVAFLVKTTLASLILFVMAAVGAMRKRSDVLIASILFMAMFFAVSMTSRIALGIRYVLPVYPFFYTAIAIGLARVVTEKRRAAAAGLFVAWHCLSSLIAYPSYISYFNELIGSRRNADRVLIDSNLDWGQDLRRLKLWCDANGVDRIRVDYFGGGDPAYEFGSRAQRWPGPRPQLLPKGWFALSRHFYRVSFDPSQSPVDYDVYLAASKARYVTTVGGSIDVYRVD
jgi:hypothetical protein